MVLLVDRQWLRISAKEGAASGSIAFVQDADCHGIVEDIYRHCVVENANQELCTLSERRGKTIVVNPLQLPDNGGHLLQSAYSLIHVLRGLIVGITYDHQVVRMPYSREGITGVSKSCAGDELAQLANEYQVFVFEGEPDSGNLVFLASKGILIDKADENTEVKITDFLWPSEMATSDVNCFAAKELYVKGIDRSPILLAARTTLHRAEDSLRISWRAASLTDHKWSIETEDHILQADFGDLNDVAVDPLGCLVAVVGSGLEADRGAIIMCDIRSAATSYIEYDAEDGGVVKTCKFSPDGYLLVCLHDSGHLRVLTRLGSTIHLFDDTANVILPSLDLNPTTIQGDDTLKEAIGPLAQTNRGMYDSRRLAFLAENTAAVTSKDASGMTVLNIQSGSIEAILLSRLAQANAAKDDLVDLAPASMDENQFDRDVIGPLLDGFAFVASLPAGYIALVSKDLLMRYFESVEVTLKFLKEEAMEQQEKRLAARIHSLVGSSVTRSGKALREAISAFTGPRIQHIVGMIRPPSLVSSRNIETLDSEGWSEQGDSVQSLTEGINLEDFSQSSLLQALRKVIKADDGCDQLLEAIEAGCRIRSGFELSLGEKHVEDSGRLLFHSDFPDLESIENIQFPLLTVVDRSLLRWIQAFAASLAIATTPDFLVKVMPRVHDKMFREYLRKLAKKLDASNDRRRSMIERFGGWQRSVSIAMNSALLANDWVLGSAIAESAGAYRSSFVIARTFAKLSPIIGEEHMGFTMAKSAALTLGQKCIADRDVTSLAKLWHLCLLAGMPSVVRSLTRAILYEFRLIMSSLPILPGHSEAHNAGLTSRPLCVVIETAALHSAEAYQTREKRALYWLSLLCEAFRKCDMFHPLLQRLRAHIGHPVDANRAALHDQCIPVYDSNVLQNVGHFDREFRSFVFALHAFYLRFRFADDWRMLMAMKRAEGGVESSDRHRAYERKVVGRLSMLLCYGGLLHPMGFDHIVRQVLEMKNLSAKARDTVKSLFKQAHGVSTKMEFSVSPHTNPTFVIPALQDYLETCPPYLDFITALGTQIDEIPRKTFPTDKTAPIVHWPTVLGATRNSKQLLTSLCKFGLEDETTLKLDGFALANSVYWLRRQQLKETWDPETITSLLCKPKDQVPHPDPTEALLRVQHPRMRHDDDKENKRTIKTAKKISAAEPAEEPREKTVMNVATEVYLREVASSLQQLRQAFKELKEEQSAQHHLLAKSISAISPTETDRSYRIAGVRDTMDQDGRAAEETRSPGLNSRQLRWERRTSADHSGDQSEVNMLKEPTLHYAPIDDIYLMRLHTAHSNEINLEGYRPKQTLSDQGSELQVADLDITADHLRSTLRLLGDYEEELLVPHYDDPEPEECHPAWSTTHNAAHMLMAATAEHQEELQEQLPLEILRKPPSPAAPTCEQLRLFDLPRGPPPMAEQDFLLLLGEPDPRAGRDDFHRDPTPEPVYGPTTHSVNRIIQADIDHNKPLLVDQDLLDGKKGYLAVSDIEYLEEEDLQMGMDLLEHERPVRSPAGGAQMETQADPYQPESGPTNVRDFRYPRPGSPPFPSGECFADTIPRRHAQANFESVEQRHRLWDWEINPYQPPMVLDKVIGTARPVKAKKPRSPEVVQEDFQWSLERRFEDFFREADRVQRGEPRPH
eukprot:Clim_evm19s23 gene=Clim_evmTU19s23